MKNHTSVYIGFSKEVREFSFLLWMRAVILE